MIKYVFSIASLLAFVSPAIASSNDPLVGTWSVVDNRLGYHVADMAIRKNAKTQVYSAVVTRLIPLPNSTKTVNTHCEKCQGSLKNTPVVGMEALQGMVMSDMNTLTNGTWTSPTEGRIYQMDAKVSRSNNYITLYGKTAGATLTMTWSKK